MWMNHVTHVNESWHTYEWNRSHIWMSHVTHMNESCRKYTPFLELRFTDFWVKPHIRMSRTTHIVPHMCGLSLKSESHSWHTHSWHVTHSWQWHMNESYHTYRPPQTDFWVISESCHTYEWVDSFVFVSCLVHMCVTTHSYVTVTNEWHVTNEYVTNEWHMNESYHTWMRHDTNTNE